MFSRSSDNLSSEIMLCDFYAGVEVVSFLKISPAVSLRAMSYRIVESSSWHKRRPGETRVSLDYSRMVSFYDTTLFPGLQAHRLQLNQDRWDHNIESINPDEIQ